ncbi:MAG TPA: hypothetical protein VH814_04955 [Steroidobacteraceae bacterium]|jgi:hypothetical protein
MNIRTRVFATLGLAVLSAQAAALPKLILVQPSFSQTGANGSVNAGLIVEASTSLPVLVIGGGFTITCNTSTLQHTAERMKSYSSFFGPHESLEIPEVVPSVYPIPGWSTVEAGQCGECVMQYKGEARDETSLSIRVGSTGIGANFTLIPAGEELRSDSILANVCRYRQRQCCTPLCAIP